MRDFTVELVHQLVGNFTARKQNAPRRSIEHANAVRLQVEHLHTPVICCKSNDQLYVQCVSKNMMKTQKTTLVVQTRTIHSRRGRLLSSVKHAWSISVSNMTRLVGKTITLKSNIGTENICFSCKISGLSVCDVMFYFFTQIYHSMTKNFHPVSNIAATFV